MNNVIQRTITSLFLFSGLIIFLFYLPPIYFSTIITCAFILILFYEWPPLIRTVQLKLAITFFYLCLPFYSLISLIYFSSKLVFLLISLVALFDTTAYIVGKLLGSHKIVPKISPGKSWEGLLGGFFAVLITIAFSMCQQTNYFVIFLLAFTIAILAFAGDLFESYLKRKAGIKHSSSLLPGHGGILDRIDGLLPVSILFFLLKKQLLILFCL